MYRNFFRRIEVCFPLLDPKIKKRIIKEGLEPYLKDNLNAWEMLPDSNYKQRSARRGYEFSAQQYLMAELGQDFTAEL
jgi:polyphosphate kinase